VEIIAEFAIMTVYQNRAIWQTYFGPPPNGKRVIRVVLPNDEEGFSRSRVYADLICEHIFDFLHSFDTFKLKERENYIEKYNDTGIELYKECAAEIGQLVIDAVEFNSDAHPQHAEVICREISSSWRSWFCGFADGRFYSLMY
jgi:hypothetical protein